LEYGSHFRLISYWRRLRLATFSVLSDHGWIESGETIYETRLVTIPQEFHSEDKLAIKASLRITSMSIIPIWRKAGTGRDRENAERKAREERKRKNRPYK